MSLQCFLLLAKISLRMDQPLAALEVFRTGLDTFPGRNTYISPAVLIMRLFLFSFFQGPILPIYE